jgi:hypothetical protein
MEYIGRRQLSGYSDLPDYKMVVAKAAISKSLTKILNQ